MDDTTEQLLWEDEADEYVENEEEQQDQADADQPAQEQQQEHVGDQGAKEVEQPKPARTRTAIVFQPDSRPSTRPGEEAQQAQQQQAKPAPSRQALANKVTSTALLCSSHLRPALRLPSPGAEAC
jgi:hypothetical protein